jgi:hypothetical protein
MLRRKRWTDRVDPKHGLPCRARKGTPGILIERFPLSILQFLFRLTIAGVFWNPRQTKIAFVRMKRSVVAQVRCSSKNSG